MPCFKPLRAVRAASGAFSFVGRGELSTHSFACGQCIGCRLERSRQAAVRCVNEASLYEDNQFLTLTYSDEFVPHGLVYRDFVLFMKRYRKRFAPRMIRFFMCGEYGGLNGRPHFHACIFNHRFGDLKLHSVSGNTRLYTSAILSSLWKFGHASVGELNFESAAYVARYVCDKQEEGARKYELVDYETGEVSFVAPEFCQWSRDPGVGYYWLRIYGHTDVFPHDRVVSRGVEGNLPRYYDKLWRRMHPRDLERAKELRILDAKKRWDDNTVARRMAKETVARARLSFSKRNKV